jgi:arginine-tRNA-protein transferase
MPPREELVYDEEQPCPYRDGMVSRLPHRWQRRMLSPVEFDQSLAEGDRRVGRMLYRTACPACVACEPLRIPVAEWQPSRSQRRVWRRNEDLQVEVGPASFSEEKLALYNRHKSERGLARSEEPMSRSSYERWFVLSCTRTVEMRYTLAGRLVGLGIVDVGQLDASSVYFFFDPDESRRSLGVMSVMAEIAWLKAQGGRFHYLGLYVEDCRHLVYKATYLPHERRIGGAWQRALSVPAEETAP